MTASDDTDVGNMVSISNSGEVMDHNEAMGNVISIPEGSSLNDIITLHQGSSDNDNATVQEDGKNASRCDQKLDSAEEASSFLMDGIVSLSDFQPSTSQDMVSYTNDYHDDLLSESLQTPKVHQIDEDPYISPRKDSKQKGKEMKKNQVNSNNYQLATTENSSLAK